MDGTAQQMEEAWASGLAVDLGGVMGTMAGSVMFGEYRLAYDVTGEGPTVVLIPGAMTHRGRWHGLGYVERLATRYQVVAIDPLGHGDSDKPVVAAVYDLIGCADHVVAVLDDVGVDRAAVWGYSRGGAICAALTGHRPDRLWAVVTGGFGFSETPRLTDEAVAARRRSISTMGTWAQSTV